ncbi:cytochrome P450 [Auricularia subglabra TFB-10046 SS5]|nr:cytochrome P450 [Auricularia subglabra TFB-10046 SS5]
MPQTHLDIFACALCVVSLAGFVFVKRRLTRTAHPFPPGPPPVGLAGNAKDMPTSNQWAVYKAMGDKYGPVVHLRVFYKHFIVVNTLEVVSELFDKRSAIYSDRPSFPMLDLMGWAWNTGLMPYGQTWRTHRRVLHGFFHEGAAKNYEDIQTRNNLVLLSSLLASPDAFRHHIRRLASANVLAISYGIKIGAHDDPWVTIAEEGTDNFGLVRPGAYIVDWIPALKYIPTWFPGAGFKRQALVWRRQVERMLHAPLDLVKSQIAAEKPVPSIAAELLQNGLNGQPVPEEVIRNSASIAYAAGSETTSTTLLFFMLAMLLNPEKQRLAQDELTRVVGPNRLPEFNDRQSLPYVEALMLEVFRMYPVFRIGLPRRVMSDDVFQGMRIPKGATIIPNAWGMLHDERLYPQPHSFMPERFLKDGELDPTVPDPRGPVFGWGRRFCLGRPHADKTVWLAVATTLACFDIRKKKDADGAEIAPNQEMRSGMLVSPEPFQCDLVPRSRAVEQVVQLASDQV